MAENKKTQKRHPNEELQVFRTLFNSTPVLMLATDMKGTILTVNDYWFRTMGYTADEVIGTPFTTYLTKASAEKARELLPELLSKGVITNREAQAITKTGTTIDVLVNSKVGYDSDGKPSRLITSLLDITERKHAEETRRLRESYLTAIIENQPGLVWLKDAESRFLAVNHAFANSCGKKSPEELIGKSDYDIWPRELAEKYRLDDASVMKNDTPVHMEEQISDKGERRWFETFKTPVKNSSGEIIGTTGYAHDITDRKLEEEALRNVQKLESLGVLAGGIAHDFNNLLSGIFGCIDLGITVTSEQPVADILKKALGAIDRSRDLTRQLLTFAKGGAPIKKIESLVPFIRETVAFALSGSRVSASYTISPDLWMCEFDKNQIAQVIDNIVINAQQAMPDGGTIEITAENLVVSDKKPCSTLKKGHYVRIAVTDDGTGMDPEMIQQIFDPFFTTKAKGHGLGLATCYSIVNKHGGCIEVDSAPGNGSTFHVYLPAVPGATGATADSITRPFSSSGTIIIMDDEEIIRYTLTKMLQSLGFTVIATKNGNEVMAALRDAIDAGTSVEAIILDLTIPGGPGGQETIFDIRSIDRQIPVYVASGYADNPVMSSPKTYGFTGSICKPYSLQDLTDMLRKSG